MILGRRSKDPEDVRIYQINWSNWLKGSNTIASSSWGVPDDLINNVESFTATATQVKISGGTAGSKYTVSNLITTSSGESKKVSFYIVVEE